MRSVVSSMSVSDALGELSFSYVLFSTDDSVVPACTDWDDEVGVASEGESEKREGDSTRKSRCWSYTYQKSKTEE